MPSASQAHQPSTSLHQGRPLTHFQANRENHTGTPRFNGALSNALDDPEFGNQRAHYEALLKRSPDSLNPVEQLQARNYRHFLKIEAANARRQKLVDLMKSPIIRIALSRYLEKNQTHASSRLSYIASLWKNAQFYYQKISNPIDTLSQWLYSRHLSRLTGSPPAKRVIGHDHALLSNDHLLKPSSTTGQPARQRPSQNSPDKTTPILSSAIFRKLNAIHPEFANALAIRQLFGPNLKQVTFQQSGNNTCYLLASVDAILHHPKGEAILRKIKIRPATDGYQVCFPGQTIPICIGRQELAEHARSGVRSDFPGIALLEKAYLKTPDVVAGRFEHPVTAMERIFGWRPTQTESISLLNHPSAKQFIGGIEFPFKERKAQLVEYLKGVSQEKDPNDVDILTAIRSNASDLHSKDNSTYNTRKQGNHYYSIRLDASTPEQITYADPFDTQNRVKSLPIDDFLSQFHIEGIRLSLQNPATH